MKLAALVAGALALSACDAKKEFSADVPQLPQPMKIEQKVGSDKVTESFTGTSGYTVAILLDRHDIQECQINNYTTLQTLAEDTRFVAMEGADGEVNAV